MNKLTAPLTLLLMLSFGSLGSEAYAQQHRAPSRQHGSSHARPPAQRPVQRHAQAPSQQRRTQPASHAQRAPAQAATHTGQRRVAQPTQRAPVQHASHGEVIMDDGASYASCESCGGGGCTSCGPVYSPAPVEQYHSSSCSGCDSCGVSTSYCGSCNAPSGFCFCFPSHGWVHAEYLLWSQKGMDMPALVTTSTSTVREEAGVLGLPLTSVLFGNSDDILDDDKSGFRIRFGWWLQNFCGWGIEGEYLGFNEDTTSFFRRSQGEEVIARPFFNGLNGGNDAELVSFPGVVGGSVAVDIGSQFDGAAVRLRKQLCCSSGCCFSQIACRDVPYSSRIDMTIGYRFWELDERLQVREQLQLLGSNENGTFDIFDNFDTRNQFNGAEIGFIWQGRRGWWSLDALMRVGIGNVHQTVTISGSTNIVENGVSSDFDSGFLAQRSNIGTYDRDRFVMVPELGLTLGYQLTKRLRGTIGYSVIYWGNVVRPGDQIDPVVNPNLLAPEVDPFSGPLRPEFVFNETDYWIQGLSFGAEFRW